MPTHEPALLLFQNKQDCPRTMAQLPKNPMRLTTSACCISINSIKFCKIKKTKIKTREAAHKMRQLQINIGNLSWTSEVYVKRLRRYMLCKAINKLFCHAIISKISKTWSKMFLKLWNHTFAADPAWIWNDRMKTVADAIWSYYILYHYFKI